MDYKRKILPEAKPTVQQNPTPPKRPQPKTPVYFWKPHEIPYGIFSQWYKQDFKVTNDNSLFSPWYEQGFKVPNGDGTGSRFNCAEQYMMHRKALLFKDEKTAALILSTSDPQVQRKLGRAVKGFDEKIWKRERTRIVRWGNYWKFKEDPSALLNTGDRELVEASPYDRVWGIGFSPREANEKDRNLWGTNLLGGALVAVRKRFREEIETENAKKREEKKSAKKREEKERECVKEKEKEKERECVEGKVKGMEKEMEKLKGMEKLKEMEKEMEKLKEKEKEKERECVEGKVKGMEKEMEKLKGMEKLKEMEKEMEKLKEMVKEMELEKVKVKEKEKEKEGEKDRECVNEGEGRECVKEGDVKK